MPRLQACWPISSIAFSMTDQATCGLAPRTGSSRSVKPELADFADGRVRKVTPVSYGVRDGMKTRAGNDRQPTCSMETSDGLLLFTSLKGVVVVDPSRLTSSSYVPPVHIEGVTVNRQKQPLDREPSLPAGRGRGSDRLRRAELSESREGPVLSTCWRGSTPIGGRRMHRSARLLRESASARFPFPRDRRQRGRGSGIGRGLTLDSNCGRAFIRHGCSGAPPSRLCC